MKTHPAEPPLPTRRRVTIPLITQHAIWHVAASTETVHISSSHGCTQVPEVTGPQG